MFTGIIEALGKVTRLTREQDNLHITIQSPVSHELKIDQSVAHNGVCLTVVALSDDSHTVTAIDETLQKTNLGSLQEGAEVNLERAMKMGDRLDGHIVQGHVDGTGICTAIHDAGGSTEYTFSYPPEFDDLIIEKGSICMNGTSLTAYKVENNTFTVAIIPYTFEHTTIKHIQTGDVVNLEFDILGKYIRKMHQR
jgi:riboflavin synthase